MCVVIRQIESEPESYPDAPSGLSTSAAALADVAWARIESYIAHRYSVRDVVWIATGPGEWCPTLQPANIASVEIWADGVWSNITPDASPLGGYWLTGHGPYRFTGTVGEEDADVPDIVGEAVKRLAEYLAADPGEPGASSERVDITDIESRSVSRSPTWMAKAIQNSGAADLLRGFRNV